MSLFIRPTTTLLCFKKNSLHENIPKRGIIAAFMCQTEQAYEVEQM